LHVAHSHFDSDSHGNAYSDRHIHANRDPNPDAYANAMHGEMYTDTEASPNPASTANTVSKRLDINQQTWFMLRVVLETRKRNDAYGYV
jgi:hypothetical protein